MIHRLYFLRAFFFLFAILALPALACDFSFATASITNAVMATDVQGDRNDPVGVAETFTQDQSILHAVVTIANAPSDTTVKSVWIAMDVGTVAAPNTKIGETELKVEGSRNLDFKFSPATRLPTGKYKVEIYLNDKLDRTLQFSVTALTMPAQLPPQPHPSDWIARVTLATGVKPDTLDAINPTTEFKSNDVFHAIVAIQNAPAQTRFKAMWYATDVGSAAAPNYQIHGTESEADGTRNIDFNLTPSQGWPPGKYRVEIFVNGVLDRVVNFSVK